MVMEGKRAVLFVVSGDKVTTAATYAHNVFAQKARRYIRTPEIRVCDDNVPEWSKGAVLSTASVRYREFKPHRCHPFSTRPPKSNF